MREKLHNLISERTGNLGIRAETAFDDLELDSLEFIDLIQAIESVFSCKIPDDDFRAINCVGDLYRYLPA